jgi:heme oxygenase
MLQVRTIPSAPSFLHKATKRLHHKIDQTSVLALLTIPGVTLDLYGTAMQSLERAYEEIDCALLQSCGLCPTGVPFYIPRGPSLKRDLVALDLPPDDSRRAKPRSALKVPDNEAAYLGMRYVVEGAQLGSRLIYGHLYGVFGHKLSGFGSFWMPGSVLQGSWPCVLKSLARMESRASLAVAARSARLTFRHMDRYLGGNEKEAP